jgi:hypothetical protein
MPDQAVTMRSESARSYFPDFSCVQNDYYSCGVVAPSKLPLPRGQQRNSLFVNGVLNSDEDARQSAQLLADTYQRPMSYIVNQSDGEITDVKNAAGGLSHPFTGARIEKSVGAVFQQIAHHLSSEAKGVLDIHAHSQGAIIVANALEHTRQLSFSHLNDEQWLALTDERLSVTTYGAPVSHFSVRGVKAFNLDGDLIPVIATLGKYIPGMSYPYDIEAEVTEAFQPKSFPYAHLLSTYAEAIPKFYAQKILTSPGEAPIASGKEVGVGASDAAQMLAAYVKSGEVSPDLAVEVVKQVVLLTTESHGKKGHYAEEFFAECHSLFANDRELKMPKDFDALFRPQNGNVPNFPPKKTDEQMRQAKESAERNSAKAERNMRTQAGTPAGSEVERTPFEQALENAQLALLVNTLVASTVSTFDAETLRREQREARDAFLQARRDERSRRGNQGNGATTTRDRDDLSQMMKPGERVSFFARDRRLEHYQREMRNFSGAITKSQQFRDFQAQMEKEDVALDSLIQDALSNEKDKEAREKKEKFRNEAIEVGRGILGALGEQGKALNNLVESMNAEQQGDFIIQFYEVSGTQQLH